MRRKGGFGVINEMWRLLKESQNLTNAFQLSLLSLPPADGDHGCFWKWKESRNAAPLLESLACAPADCETEGHRHRCMLRKWRRSLFTCLADRELKCFIFSYSGLQRSIQWHQQYWGGGVQCPLFYLEPHWGSQGKQITVSLCRGIFL